MAEQSDNKKVMKQDSASELLCDSLRHEKRSCISIVFMHETGVPDDKGLQL